MSTQQTYDQRVRAIAEEMALVTFKESLKICRIIGENQYNRRKREAIEQLLPAARMVVKRLADVARSYLYSRFVREGYSGYDAETLTEKELKFQGLIPDQEAGKDGKG